MNVKQDMPPSGGYAPVTYKRVPLKPGFSPITKLAAFIGYTGIGYFLYHYNKKVKNNEAIETRCVRLALTPMLCAERDRMLLKQLKRNRDAEERIMKDVEGWELGKWKGLPVFSSLDPDEFYLPSSNEYFAHSEKDYYEYATKVFFYT